jgi:HSP20 family protein
MSLIRWEPATELNTIQNEMNRLFNSFFDQPNRANGRSGGTARSWFPAMDLVETADRYILRADLPGISDEDVSVQLEDNVLTVSGERKPASEHETEGYYRIERGFGRFSRTLTLPTGVDPDMVQAHFERGVLEIAIPKPEQSKPKQVQINQAERLPDSEIIEAGATDRQFVGADG